MIVPSFGNIPSPDMCAQDAAKVHFDIDTSFFPHFQYYIWSAFSPQSAINSLQKNGSDSDSPGIVVFYSICTLYFRTSILLSVKKNNKISDQNFFLFHFVKDFKTATLKNWKISFKRNENQIIKAVLKK